MRKTNLLILFIILLLQFMLESCLQKKQILTTKTKASRTILRYPIRTNLSTLDPACATDLETINLMRQVTEGLVGWDENNQIVPKIAEKWEIFNNGTCYRFHLKKNIKFSNGRELTANDFKWSIERSCSPQIGSTTAALYLNDILGVKERLKGKTSMIYGVRVIHSYLLEIRIDKPKAYFLSKLVHPVASILDRRSVPYNRLITNVREFNTAAAYQINAYVPDQIIQLKANKFYYNGLPKIKNIELPVIKDTASCLNMYMAGELDFTYIQPPELSILRRHPIYKNHLGIFPSPSFQYLVLNSMAYKPFAQKKVRRAIAMAIDRTKIVKDILDNAYIPAYGVIPPHVVGYRSHTQLPAYNPIAAKELLHKEGYLKPLEMPELKLHLISQSSAAFRCAEAVAIQIRKNLGISVSLQTMDLSTFYEKRNKRQLGFLMTAWMPTYLDPQDFVKTLFYSTSHFNFSSYHHATLDKLCDTAESMTDLDTRLELYDQAEDIALWDASIIPLFYFRDLELINPRLKGLKRSLFGHLSYATLRFEEI